MIQKQKTDLALKIVAGLNCRYAKTSPLRLSLEAALATKLSGNDLSSLWAVVVSRRDRTPTTTDQS